MYGNEEFIMQDIKQIFHGFTGTRRIMNTVTDIGNRLDMLSEGAGFIQKSQKITNTHKFRFIFNMYKIKIKIKWNIYQRRIRRQSERR
jgi:hypothetical protein